MISKLDEHYLQLIVSTASRISLSVKSVHCAITQPGHMHLSQPAIWEGQWSMKICKPGMDYEACWLRALHFLKNMYSYFLKRLPAQQSLSLTQKTKPEKNLYTSSQPLTHKVALKIQENTPKTKWKWTHLTTPGIPSHTQSCTR